jgi:hypothetical protein
MIRGFRVGRIANPSHARPSLMIGLTSALLLAFAIGCGNPPSTAKPSKPAPPAKNNGENKEPRPPNPDPG